MSARRVLPVLLLASLVSSGVAAAAEQRFVVLLAGHVAGSATLRDEGGRRYSLSYEYNDRGRGPKLQSELELDSSGLPRKLRVTGNDYLKAKVDESFERTGGKATWKSQGEQGSAAQADAAYYVTFNSMPQEVEFLARAALARPAGLPLLPAGEARAVRGEKRTVEGKGGRQEVQRIELLGLDFAPSPLWVDRNDRLFAITGGGWFGLVRAGFEGALPALEQADQRAAAARSADLAHRLEHRPAALAISGARLFDSESGRVLDGTTVLVRGDRIAAVGQDGTVEIPVDAERVEAHGRMLLPGFWDMHTHLGEQDGLLHLANGVTTVRDLANDMDVVQDLKRRWESGAAVGPHVLLAGIIDGPGPYAGPTKVLVSTEAEARQWVDRYADSGYVQIKIYSSVDPKLVPAIVEEAHRRGLRVSGHVPAFMTAEQCVRLGFDEIQHANFLLLNFFAKEVPDTRTPARFHAIGERAAGLDLQSAPVQAFLDLLKVKGTVSDPTLVAFEGMFLGAPGQVDPSFASIADRLPPQVRRGLLGGGLQPPAGMEERYHEGFRAMVRLVGELHRRGITIVAGTDSLAGFAYQRELELYAQAGIPPVDILRLATLGAARVMHHNRDSGSIAPGKTADLVLVDGDPTKSISDARRADLVVKGGTLFRPAEIFDAIGVRP